MLSESGIIKLYSSTSGISYHVHICAYPFSLFGFKVNLIALWDSNLLLARVYLTLGEPGCDVVEVCRICHTISTERKKYANYVGHQEKNLTISLVK